MSNLVKTGSVVFRCSGQAIIQEVLFSSIGLEAAQVVNQPFSALAKADNLDPMLHFLEALKQFGHAEGWHLHVNLGKKPVYMTFSGLPLDNGFIIVGNIYRPKTSLADGKKKIPAQIGTSSQVSLEDNQPFTSEMDENELLDELSRLNNELINNKRELVRQNMELERLKKKENQ